MLGRVSQTVAEGNERVTAAIRDLLDEMELTDDIFRIGLGFNVGSGGKRLSEAQRQKLHLARVLLKRPDILIVNLGLNSLGHREQERMISMVLEKARGEEGFGVVWVPVNAKFAESFDRVIVFDNGEMIADGTKDDITKSNSVYQELIS